VKRGKITQQKHLAVEKVKKKSAERAAREKALKSQEKSKWWGCTS
jgi:hypothetical protein